MMLEFVIIALTLKKLNNYYKNKPILENLVSKLKKNKKNKYDCIIGLIRWC